MERKPRSPAPLYLPSVLIVLVVVMAVGLVRAFLPGGPVDVVLRFLAWLGAVVVACWVAPRREVLSPTMGAFLGVFLLFVTFGLMWDAVTGANTDVGRRFADVSDLGPPWGALVLMGTLAGVVTGALTALLAWMVLWVHRYAQGQTSPGDTADARSDRTTAHDAHDDEDGRPKW